MNRDGFDALAIAIGAATTRRRLVGRVVSGVAATGMAVFGIGQLDADEAAANGAAASGNAASIITSIAAGDARRAAAARPMPNARRGKSASAASASPAAVAALIAIAAFALAPARRTPSARLRKSA